MENTYFIRDTQQNSPTLMVMGGEPDVTIFPPTYCEIRVGDLPDSIWLDLLLNRIEADPQFFHDSLLQPYFDASEVWWTREGGFVNGSE